MSVTGPPRLPLADIDAEAVAALRQSLVEHGFVPPPAAPPLCNLNGTWNMTIFEGCNQTVDGCNPFQGGMHYGDMHIYQAQGSAPFWLEFRSPTTLRSAQALA